MGTTSTQRSPPSPRAAAGSGEDLGRHPAPHGRVPRGSTRPPLRGHGPAGGPSRGSGADPTWRRQRGPAQRPPAASPRASRAKQEPPALPGAPLPSARRSRDKPGGTLRSGLRARLPPKACPRPRRLPARKGRCGERGGAVQPGLFIRREAGGILELRLEQRCRR